MENTKLLNNENENENKNKNKRKRNRKVEDDDFNIPKINEYDNINTINYKTNQLKEICNYYKLKKSGNKNELKTRIYNELKRIYNVNKIKKYYKGFLVRKFIKLYKNFSKNKEKCVNDTDFYTLEEIKTIPYFQFLTIKEENYYYGFDICSIYNLIVKTKNITEVKNPYTRNKINLNNITNIMTVIKYAKFLNIKLNIELNEIIENISAEQKFRINVCSLFQKMDELGHYTDPEWFLSLTKLQLILFIREIIDIWKYRLDINIQQKSKILPPHGNILNFIENSSNLYSFPEKILRYKCYNLINALVTRGIDDDSKNLGTIYVLGTLTIINCEAATALPWLYETFNYNHNQINY